MSSLRELQHRFAAAVMHPLTAQEESPRRLSSEAQAIIKPNDRLTSLERLEIYSRSYWFRVLDSLAEDFPGVRAILGSKTFHALSKEYLAQHPSTSFTLRDLGSHFVSWLERNQLRLAPHAELTLEMARLEWAHMEAFDAAQRPVITPEAWARGDEQTHLALQPYLRLVSANHAVDDLLLEIRKIEDSDRRLALWRRKRLPLVEPESCCIVVHRIDYSVCYRRVEREAFQLLATLQSGAPLGEALDQAFRGSSIPEDQWPVLVQQWFGHWMSLGWFSA